jgi:flagellar hook-associated protein 3 FlgL
MRVSNNMNYEQVKGNIQKNRSEMADLQNQASTQKRITKPSDDPVGTSRMLGLRTDKMGNEQFQKNIDMAKSFLNYTESALGDLGSVIARAKELAIQASSDASSSAESRLAVATEIDQAFRDLVNIGNRKLGERFIFGGYKTTHSPFDHNGEYKGDQGPIKIEVSKGVFTTVNLPGDKVFLGKNDVIAQIPEGRKGATTPNYPGVKSEEEPAKDKTPEQEVEMRAPASTNSRAKQLDEDEKIEKIQEGKQGENIFTVFKDLSNGLRANDTVAIQGTLERLDTALEQAILLRAQVGSRTASLENTTESLVKTKIDDSALLSSIEDADAFEVFTDITKNENTLKATLQTSGKLIQPSLLDFLR